MMRTIFFFLGLSWMAAIMPAVALELDAARASEQVIELHTGYLAASQSASAEARNLVSMVNAKRRTYYQRIAAEQGVSLAQVESIFGQQIFEKGQPGLYQRIDGSRIRK